MADPLSIASASIGVIDQAVKLSKYISTLRNDTKNVDTLGLELHIYTKILEEVSQIALSVTTKLPESAILSLQLCKHHHFRLESEIQPIFGQIRRKLTKRLQRNDTGSLKKLLDIIIRIAINTFQGDRSVEEKINCLMRQLETVLATNDCLARDVVITNESTDIAANQNGLTDDVLANLREAAKAVGGSRASQYDTNVFQFEAKIVQAAKSVDKDLIVFALFDTGSAENLISASVIERARLTSEVQRTSTIVMQGPNGSFFQPAGYVSVTWSRNSIKSWHTEFLVVENASFDMLLGRKFIVTEGVLVLSDSVLVADHTRLSDLSTNRQSEIRSFTEYLAYLRPGSAQTHGSSSPSYQRTPSISVADADSFQTTSGAQDQTFSDDA
ncbi:hypothetical protein J1614_010798 [Plenodomus biglobosus]|nr:hypothetical protein J1614_010798 [Plenodomus biglobosus]